MQRFKFEAIGTHWWIELRGAAKYSDELRLAILSCSEDFARRYSRFSNNSILSQLNNQKYIENPTKEFLEMLQFGIDMYESTDGLFNMSVGAELEQSGYGMTPDYKAHLSTKLPLDITMSEHRVEIAKNVGLDFGGFGKGWLVDKISRLLECYGVGEYVVNGGGDMYVSSKRPVSLALEHPTDATQMIGTINIKHGGFAASSSQKRQWIMDNKTYSHVINTAGTKNDVALATFAKASTALMADTISTVLMFAPAKLRKKLSGQYTVDYMRIMPDLSVKATTGFGAKLYQA